MRASGARPRPRVHLSHVHVLEGSAQVECPACATLLDVHMPSLLDVVRTTASPAATLGLMSLTPAETRLFDVYYSAEGAHVPNQVALHLALGTGYADHDLRVHLTRLRRKLEATTWRIETHRGHRAYRLVDTTALADEQTVADR